MAWSNPRTWAAGETVTSALLNAHLRDNMNVLKTRISDAGLPLVQDFASVATAGNVSTGETFPASVSYTLGANVLSAAGHALWVRGSLTFAANTNAKTVKLYVSQGTGNGYITLVSAYATSVANNRGVFDILITRVDATTARFTGWISYGGTTGGTPAVWTQFTGGVTAGTVDFAASQLVRISLQGTANDDVQLIGWQGSLHRAP